MHRTNKELHYQLDNCLNELEFASEAGLFSEFPDVERLLRSRPTMWLASHLQNAIWTVRRWRSVGRPLQPRPLLAGLGDGRQDENSRCGVLLDITAAHRGSAKGGIARLSLELARAAVETGLALPVILDRGTIRPYFREPADEQDEIKLRRDDTFVIVSHFWDPLDEYCALFDHARRVGARTVTCVHDVIPALYPALLPLSFKSFEAALSKLVLRSDLIVTLSASSAAEITDYLRKTCLDSPAPPVRWFHMGVDFARSDAPGAVCAEFDDLFRSNKVFLTVGTVLAHKGVPIAIDAFEKVWRHGHDVVYLIIGKEDPNSLAAKRKILEHPEFGRRLQWFTSVDDSGLQFAYRNSHRLVQPSVAEGFGIPMIEAASFDLPILASDLPIFREIVGDTVDYFESCDSDALADQIVASLATKPASVPVAVQSWQDSIRALHAALFG